MGLVELFAVYSLQYNLPEGLLSSLCFVESRHDITQIHYNDGKTHSYGVCQIKYETARSLGFKGSPKQLMHPKNNIKYAAAYLHHQIDRYQNIARGVAAYNRGHAGDINTSRYQQKVFKVWLSYDVLVAAQEKVSQ